MGFILWHAREWEGKISFIRKVHNFVGVYPSAHQHSNVTHTNLQSWRTVRLERTRWDKGDGARKRLWFPELAQHGVDRVKCGVNLFSDLSRPMKEIRSAMALCTVASCPSASNNYLCTSKDNLARDEDKQDDLRFDHAVNETGEELRKVCQLVN